MKWILEIINWIKGLFGGGKEMPSGIEVYNENGKLVLGTNYRGLRLLGVKQLQPLQGSFTVSPKKNEEILAFAVLHPVDTVWHSSNINFCTVNGNSISWSFSEYNHSEVFGAGSDGRVNVYVFGRAK